MEEPKTTPGLGWGARVTPGGGKVGAACSPQL